jgi:hypothetical protein
VLSHDVVSLGQATPAYALPSVQTSDHRHSAVVRGQTTRSTFWLNVPARHQRFERPVVFALPDADGNTICAPTLSGTAVTAQRSIGVGSSTSADVLPDAPMDLTIDFNCIRPGVSPVLISVPLVPSSAVSFRVVKVCDHPPRPAPGWWERFTDNGLFLALAVVAAFVACFSLRLYRRISVCLFIACLQFSSPLRANVRVCGSRSGASCTKRSWPLLPVATQTVMPRH